MPRYCVTVTRSEAFFVDADSIAEATAIGIEWQKSGARPEYVMEPLAAVMEFSSTGIADAGAVTGLVQ